MTSSPRRIILKSIDGETFEVDEAVALQMQTIKEPVEKDSADIFLPVENVKGGILSKMIGYCRMHADDHATDDKLESFDAQVVNVEQEVLFDLILAANYLDIKGLLDLTCRAVAEMIKGKNIEEIKRTFNMGELTPEEEAWAFE